PGAINVSPTTTTTTTTPTTAAISSIQFISKNYSCWSRSF
ncbi:hypothetical protein AWRI1631_151430, partial [Saccharomyces cerevisiae AWRI1631]